MYTYEYERIQTNGFFDYTTQEYQDIIDQRGRDGWRYAGFIPILQAGHGFIIEMDLIFEKEI